MRIIKQLKLKVKCLRRKGINTSLHSGDELLILVFDSLNDKLLIEKWLERVDKLACTHSSILNFCRACARPWQCSLCFKTLHYLHRMCEAASDDFLTSCSIRLQMRRSSQKKICRRGHNIEKLNCSHLELIKLQKVKIKRLCSKEQSRTKGISIKH